jgi:initiation factor 1A
MPPKSKKNIKFKAEKQGRKVETKGDNEEYGIVTKMLGDCRVLAKLPDLREVIAHIPGRFKKKKQKRRIVVGDVILICHRLYEDKSDIICIYEKDEINRLIDDCEIPMDFKNISVDNEQDDGIVFCDTGNTMFEDKTPNEFEFEEI